METIFNNVLFSLAKSSCVPVSVPSFPSRVPVSVPRPRCVPAWQSFTPPFRLFYPSRRSCVPVSSSHTILSQRGEGPEQYRSECSDKQRDVQLHDLHSSNCELVVCLMSIPRTIPICGRVRTKVKREHIYKFSGHDDGWQVTSPTRAGQHEVGPAKHAEAEPPGTFTPTSRVTSSVGTHEQYGDS
jgi:hypothetical protein